MKIALTLPSTDIVEVLRPHLLVVAVDFLVVVEVEVLSNVAEHAGPDARAWILLEDVHRSVVVSIRDDGVGFEQGRLEEAEREGRLGVAQSMRARIAAIGGTITVDSAPEDGTEWEITVPVPDRRRTSRSRPSRRRLGRSYR